MILEDVKRDLGPLFTQLGSGSGTEGEDCGCLVDINGITMCSHHKVGPDLQTGPPAQYNRTVASWVRLIRDIANNPTGPMMVRGDIYEAIASERIRDRFRAAGVRPLVASYHLGIEFWQVRKWLSDSADHSVILAIDYSVAREDGCPVGSESFGGGHVVLLTGAQRRRVRAVTRSGRVRYPLRWKTVVGDSLNDGRARPGGGTYPKGNIITRLYNYRRAAGRFGTAPDGTPRPIGKGRAVAIFLQRYD
jgi:hypothetical protein